jgi:hypothetical protein
VGPKGCHDPERVAVRHGRERGSVSLGGRRVPVTRPRMRAADGSGELPVPSYELFSGTEVLGRMAMDRMLAGLSTRRYGCRARAGRSPAGDAPGRGHNGDQIGQRSRQASTDFCIASHEHAKSF